MAAKIKGTWGGGEALALPVSLVSSRSGVCLHLLTAATLLYCHQDPASPGLWLAMWTEVRLSSGILQAFFTRLGGWAILSHSKVQTAISRLTRWQHINQSNNPPSCIYPFCWEAWLTQGPSSFSDWYYCDFLISTFCVRWFTARAVLAGNLNSGQCCGGWSQVSNPWDLGSELEAIRTATKHGVGTPTMTFQHKPGEVKLWKTQLPLIKTWGIISTSPQLDKLSSPWIQDVDCNRTLFFFSWSTLDIITHSFPSGLKAFC